MNEDDLKKLRQSFSNPYREDLPKPKKNKYGHTILTDNLDDSDPVEINIEVDNAGNIIANPTHTIMDSHHITSLIEKLTKNEPNEPVIQNNDSEPSEFKLVSNNVNLAALLSELDVMDGTTKQKHELTADELNQVDPKTQAEWSNDHSKSCLNKDCLYCLPKEAKFCLKCGTAQMPKFCTECGFSFPSMEKFCPDCGKKR